MDAESQRGYCIYFLLPCPLGVLKAFSTATEFELVSLIRCQEIQGVVKVQHAHVEEMLAGMRTV